MEEKIIEIPNFITIKIVKINKLFSAGYVESFSGNHFYRNEFDQMVTHLKFPMPYSLCFNNPVIIENSDLEDLEDKIYKLHKELKDQIPRAKFGQEYFCINSSGTIIQKIEKNTLFDYYLYRSKNYFLEIKKAKEFASKLQDYLVELWKEEYLKGE